MVSSVSFVAVTLVLIVALDPNSVEASGCALGKVE